MNTRMVSESCLIDAAPDVVAKAIASPHGLATWLCDDARSEKKPNGQLTLRWNDGRREAGRWTAYEPPQRLAWRCLDDVSGAERSTAFDLAPEAGGTRVTASEGDVATDDAAALAAAWRDSLADLKTYVERGENGRQMRQPMLGIYPQEVDAELVAKHNLPVTEGVRIANTVPDGAAAKAGLREGDVIVAIGGHAVTGWPTLGQALRAHQAGDDADVKGWRGGEELSLVVTLQGRERPTLPDTRAGVQAELRQFTDETVARLESLLAGVSDAEALFRPGEGEWNVKDVLAHLSLAERWGHDWLARLAADEQPADFPGDPESLWHKALAGQSIEMLRQRIVADFRDTEAMCLTAIEDTPPAWVFHSVASSVQFGRMHVDEHIAQIEQTLEAARSAAG